MTTPVNYNDLVGKLLISRFVEAEKLKAYLAAFAKQAQEIEDAIMQLLNERHLDVAEGVQLDIIGKIVGLEREVLGTVLSTLTDADYRRFLKSKILATNNNTSREVLTECYRLIFNFELVRVEETRGQILVIVPRAITAEERALFDLKDKFGRWVCPRTAGIALVPIAYQGEYFGWQDDPNPDRRGWGQAPWVNQLD